MDKLVTLAMVVLFAYMIIVTVKDIPNIEDTSTYKACTAVK